jgi:hypothetical protein
MLSVHRHGPLEANLREPRENVAVADEATDFLFQDLPLIDNGVEIPIVAVALQSLQKIHGKLAEPALYFIGNHVIEISPSWSLPERGRCGALQDDLQPYDALITRRSPGAIGKALAR